jgi:hypothetical protein
LNRVGSSRDLKSSNRLVAFFTPPIYAVEHIEGSRAIRARLELAQIIVEMVAERI